MRCIPPLEDGAQAVQGVAVEDGAPAVEAGGAEEMSDEDDSEEFVVVEAASLRETQRQYDELVRHSASRRELFASIRSTFVTLDNVVNGLADMDNRIGEPCAKRPRVMGDASFLGRMVDGNCALSAFDASQAPFTPSPGQQRPETPGETYLRHAAELLQ